MPDDPGNNALDDWDSLPLDPDADDWDDPEPPSDAGPAANAGASSGGPSEDRAHDWKGGQAIAPPQAMDDDLDQTSHRDAVSPPEPGAKAGDDDWDDSPGLEPEGEASSEAPADDWGDETFDPGADLADGGGWDDSEGGQETSESGGAEGGLGEDGGIPPHEQAALGLEDDG